MGRPVYAPLILLLLAAPAGAQSCKFKIAFAYWDGKTLQLGLTPDQAKSWAREKTKRYADFCLDGSSPDYVIAWTDRGSALDLSKLVLHRGIGGADPEKSINVDEGMAGATASYVVFDLSKDPAAVIHSGSSSMSAPATLESPPRSPAKPMDRGLDVSRVSVSAPDPADAMRTALNWLKKKH